MHTKPGEGDGECNYWGCRSTYHLGNSKFHMKVDYDSSGKVTLNIDGQVISGDSLSSVSSSDWDIVRNTYQSTGAVIYSSQWTGAWVPADFCGGGPGDLDGSHFEISNLKITGTVKQGPEPNRCDGPTPPTPTPITPTPSPSGTCGSYCSTTGCGWTSDWSCPWQPSGAQGHASDDGTLGYSCCCKQRTSEDQPCGGSAPTPPPPTPVPPTPVPVPTPSPAGCTCGCSGDDLKQCMEACPSDKFDACVKTCSDPCPTPPTPPPTPGCPGGSLAACIKVCPSDDPDAFEACVDTCKANCSGQSCTGSDDGSSLKDCVSNCPTDKFADCISCCEDKFPSFLQV